MASLWNFLGIGGRSSQIQGEETTPETDNSVEDAASAPAPAALQHNTLEPNDENPASSQLPHEQDHLENGAASKLDDAESKATSAVKRKRKPARRSKDKIADMPSPPPSSAHSPAMAQTTNGQAGAGEVEVPNTQVSLPETNGPLSPAAAVPESSAHSGRGKRERKRKSRADITMEMSDGTDLLSPQPSSQPEKRTQTRSTRQKESETEVPAQEIEVPSTNGAIPLPSQKRKRARKSQIGDSSVPPELQDSHNGTSVAAEGNIESVEETPQKRRRVGRKSGRFESAAIPNAETPSSKLLDDEAANVEDEQPILARSLLKTMKAKRKLNFSTGDSNATNASPNNTEKTPVPAPESSADADNAADMVANDNDGRAGLDAQGVDTELIEDEDMEQDNEIVPEAGLQNDPDVEMEEAEGDVELHEGKQSDAHATKGSKKKRAKKGKAALEQEKEEDAQTPLRKARKSRYQESIQEGKTHAGKDEGAEHGTSPATKKKKSRPSKQKPKLAIAEPTNADINPSSPEKPLLNRRNHTRDAESELAVEHTIFGEPDTKEGGDFTNDEAELLRREIRRYQFTNDLAVDDLVRMIQWTAPYGNNQQGIDEATAILIKCSRDFWKNIYDVLPKRRHSKAKGGTTGIQRYVRRKYHNFKGAGKWTPEEDELLKELCIAHPNQWTKISALMGDRDTTACRDRWRNYLQYGDSLNSKVWSEEEEKKLMDTVADVIELLKKAREDTRRPPLEEYTSRDINWQLVSERVSTRSRLQCSEKWKALLAREGQSSAPIKTPNARKGKSPKESAKMTPRKSNATPGPSRLPKKSQQVPKKNKSSGRTMLWGDKLDVIEDIMSFSFESLEEIDWDEVEQQSLGSHWSVQDRKQVLNELLDEVGEQDSFLDALGAICVYMQDHHGDELQQRYDPFAVPLLGDVEEHATDAMGSQIPNIEKKRKKRSDAGKPRTPKQTKTSKTPTSKKYSSTYLVTQSDDEL